MVAHPVFSLNQGDVSATWTQDDFYFDAQHSNFDLGTFLERFGDILAVPAYDYRRRSSPLGRAARNKNGCDSIQSWKKWLILRTPISNPPIRKVVR